MFDETCVQLSVALTDGAHVHLLRAPPPPPQSAAHVHRVHRVQAVQADHMVAHFVSSRLVLKNLENIFRDDGGKTDFFLFY